VHHPPTLLTIESIDSLVVRCLDNFPELLAD
jgi:hypothetical protein